MTTITIAARVTDSPDADDLRAIRFIVGEENRRRAEANDPLFPALPTGTNVELKQSYETCLTSVLLRCHASYIAQAIQAVESDGTFKALREAWSDATPEQKAAARTALGLSPVIP